MAAALGAQAPFGLSTGFARRTFGVFAGLALAAGLIAWGGSRYGHAVSLAGHTDSMLPHVVEIAGDMLEVPENMIRLPHQRRPGPAERLDLYVRWPQLDGYSDAARDVFNGRAPSPALVFIGFSERQTALDMSGRYEAIYRRLIAPDGQTAAPDAVAAGGLAVHALDPASGYVDEALVVGPPDADGTRFLARCLVGAAGASSVAPCERDIFVGRELTMLARFPRHLLADWKGLDAGLRRLAAKVVLAPR